MLLPLSATLGNLDKYDVKDTFTSNILCTQRYVGVFEIKVVTLTLSEPYGEF